jgi:chemotaxis protein MotB
MARDQAADVKTPIVIRRSRKRSAPAHGAAWKIAYADFVTAMMAFFLLMWLLGSTAKGDLEGIADYFNTPLKVALSGGSGSGDSSSVIKGGGQDLTRQSGQVKRGDEPQERRTINLQAARGELARGEIARLKALKARVEEAIQASVVLKNYRDQIRVDLTADGLQIQVFDAQNRPMFDTGSAVIKDHMHQILREIAVMLNDVPNRISIAGHTDDRPYAGGDRGYSNWELSADRANACRRELVAGGIADQKILRVVGLAAAAPQDRNDPGHPNNRRISIIVLNAQAEARIRGDDPLSETTAAAPKAPDALSDDARPTVNTNSTEHKVGP